MSTFLAFESALVSGSSSPDSFKTQLRNSFSTRGWQIIGESLAPTAILGTFPTPANAFDGSAYATMTSTSSALPLWLGFQVAAGFTPTKMYINTYNNANYGPRDFTLDWSDNGSSWTTLQTFNEALWSQYERRGWTIVGASSHQYWRINVTTRQPGAAWTEITEFVLEDTNGIQVSNNIYFYTVPPVTETVGNAFCRDVLKFTFTTTAITVDAVQQLLTPKPQFCSMYEKTAGAVAYGFSISGPSSTSFAITASFATSVMTVTSTASPIFVGMLVTGAGIPANTIVSSFGTGSGGNGTYNLNTTPGTIGSQSCTGYGSTITGATGSAGSTAKDNLRSLYEALRDTSDTNFTDWNWSYQKPSPQNSDDTMDVIYGERKTKAANIYITFNSNINGSQLNGFYNYAPMINNNGSPALAYTLGTNLSITTDYTNGWIYYLQINSRAFAIASKTNVSFYGALHGSYATNSYAVASMPSYYKYLSPIELFVGYDGLSTNLDAFSATSHFWKLQRTFYSTVSQAATYGCTFFGGGTYRDIFHDANAWDPTAGSSNGFRVFTTLYSSNIFTSTDSVGDNFQIHKVGMSGVYANSVIYPTTGDIFIPLSEIHDWYKFRGTATNEALLLVSDTTAVSTLSGNLDASTTPGSISLSDASNFQSSGFFIIENESFQYTGKSGNTLTGITRAVYGSSMAKHYSGDIVSQGLWFTVINGSALFCGYVKPS